MDRSLEAAAENLDNFVNLRRWFDRIAARPGTRRAYTKGKPFSAQPAVTEEGQLVAGFGQS
jgi:GSH-dependent disulfide-bond oxidoreductase